DLLFGNLGADTFDFSQSIPSGLTTATADRIGDFSSAQGDKIKIDVTGAKDFVAFGSGSATSVETAITATNNSNTFATHNVVCVFGPGTDGFLLVDRNGGGVDYAVVIENITTLTASDIIAT